MVIDNPPSRAEIERFIMNVCTRECLVAIAERKGVKLTKRMSKKDLCAAVLR